MTNCVTMTNTGTIALRLGGTAVGQFDRILAGQVTLGGTLDVQLVNGFIPSSGDMFGVLSYSSRTGTFSVVNGNGHTYVPTVQCHATDVAKAVSAFSARTVFL